MYIIYVYMYIYIYMCVCMLVACYYHTKFHLWRLWRLWADPGSAGLSEAALAALPPDATEKEVFDKVKQRRVEQGGEKPTTMDWFKGTFYKKAGQPNIEWLLIGKVHSFGLRFSNQSIDYGGLGGVLCSQHVSNQKTMGSNDELKNNMCFWKRMKYGNGSWRGFVIFRAQIGDSPL